MKNVKSKTKEQLAAVLQEILKEKPFSKINIDDIVARAGVSRQCFYRHFLDKYDALAYLYKCDIDNLRLKYPHNDIVSLSIEVLSYFKNNAFIYKDLGCDFSSYNPFMNFWIGYCKEYMISNIGKNKITPEITYALEYYLHACYFIHFEYMTHHISGTPEEISRITTRNMPEILKPFFSLPS